MHSFALCSMEKCAILVSLSEIFSSWGCVMNHGIGKIGERKDPWTFNRQIQRVEWNLVLTEVGQHNLWRWADQYHCLILQSISTGWVSINLSLSFFLSVQTLPEKVGREREKKRVGKLIVLAGIYVLIVRDWQSTALIHIPDLHISFLHYDWGSVCFASLFLIWFVWVSPEFRDPLRIRQSHLWVGHI